MVGFLGGFSFCVYFLNCKPCNYKSNRKSHLFASGVGVAVATTGQSCQCSAVECSVVLPLD